LKFGGQVDHLRVMTYAEPLPDGDGRRHYLMLYDSVPGGTGYLQDLMQAPDALLGVFERAWQRMTGCRCNQEPGKDGCYHCLFAYRNSYGMESTSRSTAVDMFGEILAHREDFEPVATVEQITVDMAFDSELEAAFIAALDGRRAQGVVRRGQLVNDLPGHFLEVGGHRYSIELHAQLDPGPGPAPGAGLIAEADFLIRRVDVDDGATFRPIAVFLDGFQVHRQRVADDSAKRLALVQSGRFWVWSLTADDVGSFREGQPVQAGSPFAAQLQAAMKPLQDRFVQGFGIDALFKVALQTPMAMLMAYLSDPDEQAWTQLAFVRMLAWIDPTTMNTPGAVERFCEGLRPRVPESFRQRVTDLAGEAAVIAYGGLAADAGRCVAVDCGLSREAIGQQQPGAVVCALSLDDEQPLADGFSADWQVFLMTYNLLQFLPLTGFFTHKGIASGVYEGLHYGQSGAAIDEPTEDWDELLEQALDTYRSALQTWLSDGGLAPVCGFEWSDDDGEILAEAELGWEEARVVALLQEQMDERGVWETGGWRVLLLDTGGEWLQAAVLADCKGLG
jgi:DEAD/DEAH box helicase domain-containing protein